ncbi:integrator complex subunit 11 [Apostasia shenzhenica]|uniref:Integrator complex subunit 11 n=1 Tax=Apostasia shenzhenica TaxID=1088818 RepID=A0A2I0A3C6_9ASPA|nr:integrator complex subunit 11 [Apostasia shenzhenica]
MNDFNNAIMEAGLEDAGYSGNPYTWSNSRLSERIDRAFINRVWISHFNDTVISHLDRIGSDHASILIEVKDNNCKVKPSFRFQNMWCKHKDFLEVVRNSLEQPINSNCPLTSLHLKLKRLKFALSSWNKFWRQKATVKWWKEGDSNINFFHNAVKKKRKKLNIDKLRNEEGSWISSPEDIENSGTIFYSNLLKTEGCHFSDTDFYFIPNLIVDHDNEVLTAVPNLDEVKDAVFSIHKDSAAGPDGFNSGFFQCCWDIVKDDLLNAARGFFSGYQLDKAYTSTLIVLIPKSNEVNTWKDLWSISLCNVKMKFLSKILVKRLSYFLPKIISPNQTGFVPGRGIVDNILLAQEVFHTINFDGKGRNIALKLDMEKAYDRVEWNFIIKMLNKFGFSNNFCNLINNLISNVWFSILINGRSTGFLILQEA